MVMTMEAWARRWRRLFSPATRRRGEAGSGPQSELIPTICFGLLGGPEELSLKDLVADQRAPVREASRPATDDDPRT
jgi:hypothetical protein